MILQPSMLLAIWGMPTSCLSSGRRSSGSPSSHSARQGSMVEVVVDVDEEVLLDEMDVDVDEEALLDEVAVDVDDDVLLDEAVVDVDDDVLLDEAVVEVDDDVLLDEIDVDVDVLDDIVARSSVSPSTRKTNTPGTLALESCVKADISPPNRSPTPEPASQPISGSIGWPGKVVQLTLSYSINANVDSPSDTSSIW
eukprot:CAMPEP_0178452238 /NCGR_PEP_ID=MMETSP0689_2-20121128/44135_1 /TAXON_ID=160604 /ORGANISM="Amphidinium massartii, Strain CS-259" /LENGTH=195 /DNA_ID=CAMNT_0020077925 /DNA_START=139 /DNA_END=726 /DNA_ORIENTATION=-